MEHVTEQQLTRRQSTVWRALRAAAPQTIPVLAGYFVLGMGYGIYVQSLGLPVWMPMLMGTVVYGGSLEFVLASLLLSAFSPLSAFLMALMIQARHLFYGLAMLERYKGYGLRSFYMIFAMSDETFSITCSAEPPEGVDRGWFMFFITLLDQCYWVASAGLGAVVGSVLPFSTEGVDFVMTAMFTVIFLNQWEKDRQHYSALIGLAMLERYKGYGLRSFYMIFAMSDETFSITCSAEPPEGVDRGWFMFFITLLDQCYWVASAGLGAVVGSVLPFSTEGVDFVMTAMFTVIFLNQWEKDRQHYSALIGLAAPLACLVVFGSGSFLLPSMGCILILLLALRKPIEKAEGTEAEKSGEEVGA